METIAKYLKENGINEIITIGSMGNEGVGLFSTSGLAPTFYFNNLLNNHGFVYICCESMLFVANEGYLRIIIIFVAIIVNNQNL